MATLDTPRLHARRPRGAGLFVEAWRALVRAVRRAASVAYAAWRDFRADDGLLLSGALAFFSALSLAPLLIVLVGAATFLVDEGPVRREVLDAAERVLGLEGRSVAQTLLDRFARPGGNVVSIVVGAAALFLGCTSVFAHLRTALNRVWNVRDGAGPRPVRKTVFRIVRKRFYSLIMVGALGVLLLASLVLTTVLSAVYDWVDAWVDIPWRMLDWGVSLLLITALIAAVFKTLPDVKLSWRDVALGSLITALLFAAGKSLFGYYLTHKAVSAYGAAGSFVVVLLWLYYSSIVLLYGAELTQVFVTRAGRKFIPRRGAEHDPAYPHGLPPRLREQVTRE